MNLHIISSDLHSLKLAEWPIGAPLGHRGQRQRRTAPLDVRQRFQTTLSRRPTTAAATPLPFRAAFGSVRSGLIRFSLVCF